MRKKNPPTHESLHTDLHTLTASCRPEPPILPKDMDAWEIGVTAPSLYPVSVRRAYGINETYDWTSLIHNFVSSAGNNDFKTVRHNNPDYQGYAIPLGVPVKIERQIQPITLLPDMLVVEWGSWVTNRCFITRLLLTETLKKRMDQQRQKVNHSYSKPDICYQRTMVFGLLPDGRARVWLYGCGYFSYITTLNPYREIPPVNGVFTQDSQLPSWLQRTKAQFGVDKLFPIPWDKLNRMDPWKLQERFESQQPDYQGVPVDGSVELNRELNRAPVSRPKAGR